VPTSGKEASKVINREEERRCRWDNYKVGIIEPLQPSIAVCQEKLSLP